MPSVRRLDQVIPETTSYAGPSTDEADWWLYVLRPASALPVVDFSVSVRSRFLSKRWLSRTTRWMRHGRLFLFCYVVSMGIIAAMFVTENATLAHALAIATTILQLPSCLIGTGVLRYEMVCLLLPTYDFWFFFLYILAFGVVISAQYCDARILTVITFVLGTTNNILMDGNLRGARRFVLVNLGAAITMAFFIIGVKLDLIARLRSFNVFRYGAHELPAEGVVVSSLLTVLTMVARNIVRARKTLRKGSIQQIRCVSYRCLLRIERYQPLAAETYVPTTTEGGDNQAKDTEISPIQQLQCVLAIGPIDARETLIPWLFKLVTHSPLASIVIRIAGVSTFILSSAAAILAEYRTNSKTASSSLVQLTAACVTAVFVLASATCFLRLVYKALISSFDFIYISVQLTAIHLTACDFFLWHTNSCLVVLTSWLWIHWALSIDALSPLAKDTFRLHDRFPAVVISTAIVACCVLLYTMIALDTSEFPYDRIVWSGIVLHKQVAIRVLPLFYNSIASVLAWSLRLLYRAWRFDSDVLIVLDGPVAYTNYMSQARQAQQQRQRIESRPLKLSSRTQRWRISQRKWLGSAPN